MNYTPTIQEVFILIDLAMCSCSGDPHCNSFDGRWWHYQGSCKYTLVKDDCSAGSVQSFHVEASHRPVTGKPVARIREVYVTIGGMVGIIICIHS